MDLETRLLAHRIIDNWEFVKMQYAEDVFMALNKSVFTKEQIIDFMNKIADDLPVDPFKKKRKIPARVADPTSKLIKLNLTEANMEIIEYLIEELKK